MINQKDFIIEFSIIFKMPPAEKKFVKYTFD